MSRAAVVEPARTSLTARVSGAASSLGTTWAALVPAAAVPILFLHLRYQPATSIGAGSTTIGIELSDLVVLAVVLAAALVGRRHGWEPLRAGRRLWLTSGVFLALVVVATVYPLLWEQHYDFLRHMVTAAKFCEYALLAPSLVLLLRRGEDALPLLWSVAAWSAAASAWGLAAVRRSRRRVHRKAPAAARAVVRRDPRPRRALRCGARRRPRGARARPARAR